MISNLIAILLLLPAPATASTIDDLVDRHLVDKKLAAADRCSDDVFLRRLTLDLAGRIPTIRELKQFRADPNRQKKIDELLASDEYPEFIAEIWTASFVGYLNVFGTDREALRMWLAEQFRDARPYDEISRSLITATGVSSLDGPVNFLVRNRDDPVVKVGRTFLGVRLDCAQCHDHPFDRWTQNDYQEMRRFFGQLRTRNQNGSWSVQDEVRRTRREDRPTFLTGAQPRTDHWRAELALFVTNSKPFARTFGNRIWYHLMGRGIVHPIDDFSSPAEIPELVELLAERARNDKFSMRKMMRLICNSEAYQRDSQRDKDTLAARSGFAFRTMKPLTPGQYFDSVAKALELEYTVAERQRFIRTMIGDVMQEDFNPTWDYRETVQMAMSRLTMPIQTSEFPVRELYQRILTRDPNSRELELCRDKPASDVVFALIHSNEFFFNH